MATNQNQGGSTGGRGSARGENPASHLSREDRIRGGKRSAELQQRDEFGQFAGRKGGAKSEKNGGAGRSAGAGGGESGGGGNGGQR
jgi:hypothetical protein